MVRYGFSLWLRYAIWCAVGILGQACLGCFYFKEKLSPTRVVALSLMLLGIFVLKFQEYRDARDKSIEMQEIKQLLHESKAKHHPYYK